MPAIHVQNLSKRYFLGQTAGTGGLRHALESAIRSPFKSKAKNQTPSAGEFWALRDLTFDIEPGEVVGIIGRNGAGKSTLLKLLSRITEPTTGHIGINGRVASLLEVGTGFHPELTGRENIYLNGAILGMTRSEITRKFDEIVAFAEVAAFLDTPVKRYSSGMYVRLAFSVAAHLEPEILIVDEVLAVGDSQFQQKCLGRMREVSSEGGRTVLFVSHALHSVKALCTTGILLNQGRIECRGPIDEVITAYTTGSGVPAGTTDLAANRSKGVRFVSANFEPNSADGVVTVRAQFELEKPISNAGLGLHVDTAGGYELCNLRPETTGLHFGDHTGPLEIRFEMRELHRHLGAGVYRLALSLHETNWQCVLERTSVGEFIVPAIDVFETGYPPKYEKDGPLVIPITRVE